MSKLLSLLLAVAWFTPTLADDATQRAIEQDRSRIAGHWTIVKLVVNGNEAKEDDARRLTVTNQPDGSWSVASNGEVIARGTSTIDPSAKPKTIDFTNDFGDQPIQKYEGIYQLGKNENRRRMCFAPAGQPRPAKLVSKPGSQHILVVFERIKDAASKSNETNTPPTPKRPPAPQRLGQ